MNAYTTFWKRIAAAAALAWALLPGAAASAQAAEGDCARKVEELAARQPDKGSIEEAQRQLVALGFGLEKVDGKLGRETKAALKRFCDSAKFAVSTDLLATLSNHLAIRKVYPDWTMMLASGGFAKWAARQSDAQEIGWIRSAGNSGEVIRLLDRYRKQKPVVPSTRSVDDQVFSFGLNGDDLKVLAAGDGVLKLVGKLQGKSFSSQGDFEAALDAALKGMAEPEQYVQAVLKNTAAQRSVALTEESFGMLKAANLPAYIPQALQEMQGLGYPAGEFEGAVEAALGKLPASIMKFKPQVIALAEISPSGARFTGASVGKFLDAHKDDPLAAAVAERLRSMGNIEYQSDKTLSRAVENVLKQEIDRAGGALPAILDAAVETETYRLDEAALAKLQDALGQLSVPEIYIEMLADLKDSDYPEIDLFWAAAKARVAMAGSNDPCKLVIFGVIEKHRADTLSQELLDEMKSDKLPPAVLAELGSLAGVKFDSPQALEDKVAERFGQLGEQFEQYRPLVLAQARKEHPFDPARTIRWSGEACNCVAENLAGQVFGFYPYWLAGGDKQKVDFSVLTRVEYFGVGFNDKGDIPSAARWNGVDAGFIEEARVYGSKVDLVIYRNDWKTWNQLDAETRTEAFSNLAGNIVRQLSIPLTSFASRAKPYVSFGMAPKPIRGDGVTLYFDGYPDDPESVEAFAAFVRTLSAALREEGHKYAVNIMFRSVEIGKGIYEYQRLLDMMDLIRKGRTDGTFLVLLQEPTTTDKKQLRINIENGLHGKDRMKLLHNVAVVLSQNGRGGPQLIDDVIYAGDNFGGIGFWTQPVAAGEANAADGAISKALHDNYVKMTGGKLSAKPAVCQFVCPNRWAFRITWDIFVGIWLFATVLYFVLCSWRNFVEKHFIYFIAIVVVPLFLLSLALLFCDPSWENVSRDNGLLILLVVGIIAYSIWNYRENKRKANLP